ncbi:hypothetical protein ADK53_25620 [Streptomyces sp. WM6373]|uniref:hypothetical protein n=1 Tax=Streptomyces sp. WM6373 TaxID=1415556 RepID=UPI0006ADFF1E|nr:hypothetical protein [Streptomyces sp. WM6373]KOU31407.1 hypothetical protein ADK53_25620 [Streptomyces sp. WM6373]
MTRRTTHVAALALAASLLAAGCSSSGEDGEGSVSAPKDPKVAAREAAQTYMQAVKSQDWKTACPLKSRGLLGGTVEQCLASRTDGDPSPSPSGSGPEPAGAEQFKASDAVEVAAVGKHPAGFGVLVTQTGTEPGKPTETERVALRLVEEDGSWKVDQRERVRPQDMAREPDMSALVRALITAGGQ